MRTRSWVAVVAMVGAVGTLAIACSSTTSEESPICDPAADPSCLLDGGDGDGSSTGDGSTDPDASGGDATIGDGASADAATDTGLVVLPDGSVILPDGAIVLPDGAVITDGGPLPPCVPGGTQCTNCIDDDGDGVVDWLDPECTGPLDDDEGSFATGIPGDNVDACKQDCWFDGNSGAGDDKCDMPAKCLVGSADPKCPYDPKAAADPKQCPPLSKACIDFCKPLTPKGCDCLGCCDVYKGGKVYKVKLVGACTYETLEDETKCPPCAQVPSCSNPCGECEWCLGKTELPPKCYPPPPDAGVPDASPPDGSTTPDGSTSPDAGGDTGAPPSTCPVGTGPACSPTAPCPTGHYCLTGCCIKAPS